MTSHYLPSPIEQEAKLAAEQEMKALETIGAMFKRTSPMGRRRLSEREQVARWVVATPQQREKARLTWGEERYTEWNQKMFKALRRTRRGV